MAFTEQQWLLFRLYVEPEDDQQIIGRNMLFESNTSEVV